MISKPITPTELTAIKADHCIAEVERLQRTEATITHDALLTLTAEVFALEEEEQETRGETTPILLARYRTLAPQLARAVAGLVQVVETGSEALLELEMWCAHIRAEYGEPSRMAEERLAKFKVALAALEPPDGGRHD